MKKILTLVSAGFAGGVIALVCFFFLDQNQDPKLYEENQPPRAILASGAPDEPGFNFVTAAKRGTPTVVNINVEESRTMANQRIRERDNEPFGFFNFHDFFGYDNYPRQGAGSGVVISEDGYIVTNNHVVEGGDIITVSFDEKEYRGKLVGADPSTDLALLKIDATGLEYAEFADSDDVEVGEWVVAIGNPFSYLKSTVTAGIVSAKGRDIDILKNDKAIEEFIQTDAAINPGNSGGALVNTEGELIGINTAIATPTGVYAGYSFAIPANLVKRVIDDIKENGNIERGRLGVRGRTVDEIIQNENKLAVDYGFLVEFVDNGSGAQFAGILPGDVIVEANKNKIMNFEDLYELIQFAKVGDTINLVVLRKNKELEIPVYLKRGI
jgi:S1-C subfamily serine protease